MIRGPREPKSRKVDCEEVFEKVVSRGAGGDQIGR